MNPGLAEDLEDGLVVLQAVAVLHLHAGGAVVVKGIGRDVQPLGVAVSPWLRGGLAVVGLHAADGRLLRADLVMTSLCSSRRVIWSFIHWRPSGAVKSTGLPCPFHQFT